MDQVSQKHRPVHAKPKAPRAAARRPAVARRPAYLQGKMAVSHPADAQEREADQVAQQISRTPRTLRRASLEPGIAPENEEQTLSTGPVPAARSLQRQGEVQGPVQTRPLRRAADEEEMAQARLYRQKETEEGLARTRLARQATEEEDRAQARLYRQEETEEGLAPTKVLRQGAEEEEPVQSRLYREPGEEEQSPEIQTPDGDTMAGKTLDKRTERRIEALRGMGDPLPKDALADMQARFGQGFSAVRVHTDSEAAALCAQMRARGFTVGNDIFFAPGEFAPETEHGRELLAHELTHVVQNRGRASRLFRAVTPTPSPVPVSGTAAANALDAMSVLELPPIKHRHAALYTGHGARRAAGYRRNTDQSQVSVWNNGIGLTEDTIAAKLRDQQPSDQQASFTVPSSSRAPVNFQAGSRILSTTWGGLRRRLMIPDWDRRGQVLTTRAERFQVDHMIELQVFGDPAGNAGNVIGNLELLKGRPNASSGSTIRRNIYRGVTAFLTAQNPNFDSLSGSTKATTRRNWLRDHTITYTEIQRGAGIGGDDSDWWTRTEIEAAAPLDAVQPAPPNRLRGSSGVFVLASGPGGIEIARYGYESLRFEPTSERLRTAMAGVRIREFQLNAAAEHGNAGDSIGNLIGEWDLPENVRAGEEIRIPLVAVDEYCGSPGEIPGLRTDFSPLSPLSLSQVEMRDGNLYAEGLITPSIPLLRDLPISVVLDGKDLRFQIEYTAKQLNLPIPGISMDEGEIALFYSTHDGFGGSGRVDFSVDQLGEGNLEVEVTQDSGFAADGAFNFDTELFDRAGIRVWYRDGTFGGEGEIGIDDRDKIRGILSANLAVGFSGDELNARGEVQPDIPAVERAGLTVAYSEDDGLTVGGTLQLSSDTPGIESGSVEVTVRKRDEQWKVAATGTAVPSIPGIDSQLTVAYDDGAFNAEVTARYQRGMLDGTIRAGATNRTLDAEGNPTGEPGEEMVVFGGGSLTIQIAPWLQGTAGVEFEPNGEITVTGEIGLPNELQIFPRREIDKSIFRIAVQAPIVPGIVAEIGGGLGAVAGIGPGVIDQLRLGIEYNPAHEENTHITGDAHLNVPADAGLRLSVRAGIGLGITGASVTGGLEIGGTLGIEGAAEAGVHIDWMPSTGLEINADVAVHAQPSFTFDISGYVAVTALGFSVYDQTWELASFSFGSDYRFGIRLPIHYRQGEPFDISLSDVEFEVPEMDTDQLLSGLIDRIS